jgi:hypothetical protein
MKRIMCTTTTKTCFNPTCNNVVKDKRTKYCSRQCANSHIGYLKTEVTTAYVDPSERTLAEYSFPNVRHHNRKVNAFLLSTPCVVCGYDEYDDCKELHHIDSLSSLPKTTKVKVANDPKTNIAVVCPTCHKHADKGYISKKQLRNLILKAYEHFNL